MTVGTTPRLGLMSPVDSDLFQATDFSTTFSKLDAIPGVQPVTNYAALTTLSGSLTTAQHGNQYLQLDNGAEWYWYQPSGGGVFKRKNTVGQLAYATQSGNISTAGTTHTSLTLETASFTSPGGRTILVVASINAVQNTTGAAGCSLYVNSTEVAYNEISCWSNTGGSSTLVYPIVAPTPGTSYTAVQYGYSTPTGGTTNIQSSNIFAYEV